MVSRSTSAGAGPALREAVDAFISSPRCANPNTRRAYATALDRLLADLGPDRALAQLSGDDLIEMFTTAWGASAPATWNRNRAAVLAWLTWCGRKRWNSPELPAVLERRPERADHTKALTQAAIQRQLSRRDVPLREKTLGGCCMRPPPGPARSWPWTSRTSTFPHAAPGSPPKAEIPDWVHCASGTAHLLPRLLRGRDHGPVFLSQRRRGPARRPPERDLCPHTGKARMGYDRARVLLATYTGWELHQLRHSAATHLGENNVPLQTMMAKTRHRHLRTALRYIHLSAEAVAHIAEDLLDLGRHHR